MIKSWLMLSTLIICTLNKIPTKTNCFWVDENPATASDCEEPSFGGKCCLAKKGNHSVCVKASNDKAMSKSEAESLLKEIYIDDGYQFSCSAAEIPFLGDCGLKPSMFANSNRECFEDKASKCCRYNNGHVKRCLSAGPPGIEDETAIKNLEKKFNIEKKFITCNYPDLPKINECGKFKGTELKPNVVDECADNIRCCLASLNGKSVCIDGYEPLDDAVINGIFDDETLRKTFKHLSYQNYECEDNFFWRNHTLGFLA
jgi:hypothetical protein